MEDVTQASQQPQERPHNRSKSTGQRSSEYMLRPASDDDVGSAAPTSASVYLDAPGPSHLQGYYHSPAQSQHHFEPQMDSYAASTLYSHQQPYTTADASTSTYPPSTSMLASTSMMSNVSSPLIPHPIDGPLQDPHAGPVMMARSNHGNSLDAHGYYQQRTLATQGGSFTNQGAFYPPSASASAIHGGLYPHMMGGISTPHYSANPYGVQQHQQYTYNAYNSLPLHPYNAQVQQMASWTSSPMLDASHNQQQAWMQQQKYDPYQRQHHQQQHLIHPGSNTTRLYNQTSSTSSPSGRLSSTRQSSNRSSTATNSSLPARPGGGLAPHGRSTQSASPATSAAAEIGHVPQTQPDQDEQVPGKGLRQHYHPQQGPRSDFVLWCGNVPSDATVEELWSFFSTLPPQTADSSSVPPAESRQNKRLLQEAEEVLGDPAMSPISGHGVLSVFIIARSNCAFINYATPEHLERGLSFFHGQSLRPQDPRCPKLVCRVRKKDDEAQAGVAGQRGRGMHVAWVKEQDRKTKELARSRSKTSEEGISRESPLAGGEGVVRHSIRLAGNESGIEEATLLMAASDPSSDSALAPSSLTTDVTKAASGDDEMGKRPSISAGDGSSGSISYTSTNSSLLRHPAFHERFFILKSLRLDDLDRSAETGLWATQPHNESVLDQAFRNSESVYLIFSANESGGFYGYARMAGPILSTQEKQQKQQQQIGRTNLQNAAGPLSPGSAVLQRSDTIRPEIIEEMKEEVVDSTAPFATSEAGQSQTKSPMQLTPAGEIESPMANLAPYESLSWPVQSAKGGEEQERDGKRLMQSSSYDTGPRRTTVEDPKAVLTPAPLSDTSYPNRVRKKPSMSKDDSSSSLLQASLSEAGSLGPSDSASFDSRAQQHLALRALIHNLRLEERESMMRAEQLERNIGSPLADQQGTAPPVVSTVDSTETSTPRAGSSDSFGKPFKIEWIKRSPLPFQQVRKLRNPWRDNRQIKVSRDGTELEPNVGRQLLKEWSQTVAMTRGPLQESKADFRETDLEEEG